MPVASNKFHYAQYIPADYRWYKHRSHWLLIFWIGLYLLGNCANGYDGAMVNGLQLLPEWQNSFHHPVGSTLGLLGAIQNIGSLGSIPVAPLWNDRFGRRLTVMLGGALMLTGAVLQATSKNIGWFMGGRALLGFGGGFNNNADPLMVIELCYPSQRPPIAGAYNSFVNVGSIIAAATTFGTYYITNSEWSWRLPVLIQIVPTAIQWSLIMFGPESPRWLIGKGKDEQALKILAKYHGAGDPNHPLVVYEYEEMKKAIAEEHDNKVGWTHLFKTPGMRKRSFTMMVLAVSGQWSGNAMISYYLNQVLTTVGVTDKPSQLGINLSLSICNWISGVTGALNAERFGRRRIFLVSSFSMLLMFVGITICSAQYVNHHTVPAGKTTVLFIYLFTVSYAFAWSSILALYVTEISPFSIRSKAHSLFAITQASMQTFNQYVNPIAFLALGWKYYLVFVGVIICICVFVYFFVPETRGHTLEETALLFDGLAAVKDLQGRADERTAKTAVDIPGDKDKEVFIEHREHVGGASLV